MEEIYPYGVGTKRRSLLNASVLSDKGCAITKSLLALSERK